MKIVKKEGRLSGLEKADASFPKLSSSQEAPSSEHLATAHLAFEKNYPKNIFIPLIEHLSEVGLQTHYEACVGTRESFEGKNVVSLAEIHKVLSQEWFQERINLGALTSSMSNKILMNSKIKKKLFHLLLIRQIFGVARQDQREFKKLVSKLASDVSRAKLPSDPLFEHPSALIYLLSLFTQGLLGWRNMETNARNADSLGSDDKSARTFNNQEIPAQADHRPKDNSSKEEYKYYISKIISTLNTFRQDPAELLDLLQAIKGYISQRQQQVRQKYKLPPFVPEWSHFGDIVINNCLLQKRSKGKITFSLLNQWIQDFKEKSTSLRGFTEVSTTQEHMFRPIVLVPPPF